LPQRGRLARLAGAKAAIERTRLDMITDRRIKDLPEEERPRERLARSGAENLKPSELIAILLRTGLKGKSAIKIGEELLGRFRTLASLAGASVDELRQFKGVGHDKAVTLKAAFALAADGP